ncbi:MAG: cell surface protein, partial [Isosphaeraceae bacterium]
MIRPLFFLPIGLLLASLVPTATAADAALKELIVFPAQISLTSQQDRQSMVIQAVLDNGLTEDVTLKAALKLENPALVKVDKAIFWPVADGETKLTVEYGGKSVVVPVKVAAAKTVSPISFRMDVMPVFMKANCNTGSCHGAARGKDGFRLSLFGFDAEGDHHRLTREMPGRRLNQAVPAESTMIEKAVGAVQHTGGKRIEPGSEMYQTLIRWIEAGSPNDDVAKLPKLVDVQIAPKQGVLDGKGTSQRVSVIAKYSDGTDRDVTSLSV